MKRYLKPFLLLSAVFLVGWTFLVDNFLGRPLAVTAPTNGQVYKFVSATGKWTPSTDSGGAETLSISDLTDVAAMTEASGDLLYFDTAWTRLAKGSDGQVLKLASGLPSWAADAGGAETLSISDLTDVAAMTEQSGDLLLFGSAWDRLAKGSNSTVLQVSSGGTVQWGGVTSAMITDGEIVAGDLATATVNRLNPAPAAAGNIPVDAGAGSPYTSIDGSDANTTKALFATGASSAPAFRVLAAGDIDELLASSDLTDFSSAKSGTGNSVVSDAGATIGTATLNSATVGDNLTFTSVGAAATTGKLQRNGAELSWHNGSAATNLEQVGRKDAASGYAGLTAGTKLNVSQGQEVWAIADLSDVSALGGTSADLGTSASDGSGSAVALSNHVHKGVVWQEEGANLDSSNGNKTVNVVGDGSTASATGGTATLTILASPADGHYKNLVIRRTSVTALTVTADTIVLRNTTSNKARTFRAVSETITITTAGASGLEASDSEASNTWYEIRLIAKDSDGTIDGILNAAGGSITTMPTNYDLQTPIIGYIRNDGSSNLKFIHQFNNEVMVERGANVISTGLSATSNTDVDASAFCPPGARLVSLEVGIKTGSSDNDAGATLVDKDSGVDIYSPYVRENDASTSLYSIVFGKITLNSSQVFQYRVQTNSNVDLVVVGWNF